MERFLAVLAALSLLMALVVLRAVRREHIRVEYSVSWLAAAALLFALSRAPRAVGRLAGWLGLPDGALVVLFLALIVFVVVIYRLSRIISTLRDNNIALAQRVAILEFHLRKQHEESEAPSGR
jgi:hypothetical protein